jgi:hypothetical protein
LSDALLKLRVIDAATPLCGWVPVGRSLGGLGWPAAPSTAPLAWLFVPHWVHSLLCWLSAHWGDVVPAWLGVAVAAFFGVLSWRLWLRSKAEADRATKAAEDAVAAANRLADAAERSATADETQARLAQDQADAAERNPWEIKPAAVTRWGGGEPNYRLINKRDTPKYEVYLSGDRVLRGASPSHFRRIDGNVSVPVTLKDAANVVNKTVVVSWHPTPDHTGESWKQRIEP